MVLGCNRTWSGVLALVICAGVCLGQARSGYEWKEPHLQGLSIVGGDFTRYSTGLGSLERSSPYGGSGLLRSSISGMGTLNLRRSGRTAPGMPAGLPQLAVPRGQVYKGPEVSLRVPGQGVSVYENVDPSLAGGVGLYLQAVGHTSVLLTLEDNPITSFVPAEPSRFQEYMAAGDKAFRAGRHLEALDAFDLASKVGRGVPEAHLSLVHANFALTQCFKAAQHLREALTYLPELPLVQLDIRGFYDDPGQFEKHLAEVRKRLEGWTEETDMWLVLAYFAYFDGADAEAQEAMRRAYGLSWRRKQKDNLTAVETFWEGMVAAGRATGELAATTRPGFVPPPVRRPAPTTQPGQSQVGQARPRATDQPTPASPIPPKTPQATSKIDSGGPLLEVQRTAIIKGCLSDAR